MSNLLLKLVIGLLVVAPFVANVAVAHADVEQNVSQAIYIVRRGDTLAGIAARYGTSAVAVMRANGLRTTVIYPGQRLYIPGRVAPTPARNTTPTGSTGRWIDVNLSRQILRAYEGDRVVLTTYISSGLPRTPTPVGRFAIRVKIPAQTMSGPGYYLPGVPHVMYFIGGYALHGTYWHNNFGRPMSHGCVNLNRSAAAWLYHWASVGTPVSIHY